MKVKSGRSKILIIAAVILVSIVGIVAAGQNYEVQGVEGMPVQQSDSFALHSHPKLTVYVDGQKHQVPAGIGIMVGSVIDTDISGMRMSPTHTHDVDDIIHIEQMKSNEEMTTVGYFFKVWGEKFSEDCIFEYCSGNGKTVKMFVNGKQNFEFESYRMQDRDQIEIRFE